MAKKTKTTKTSRAKTGGRGVRGVVEAQREMNRDYKKLADDYGVMASRLWKIPATRYVLGGIAVAAIVPSVIKALRKIPKKYSLN